MVQRLQPTVADVWASELGVDSIGPDDNFFELGGNSINAVVMVRRLSEQLGVELPLDQLFEDSTLVGVCRAIERLLAAQGPEAHTSSRSRVTPTGATEGPTAILQPYFHAVYEHTPRTFPTIVTEIWRFDGRLDVEAVRRAVAQVGGQHAILRTRYRRADGQLRQIVNPPEPAHLPPCEVIHADEASQAAATDELLARELDLAHGPAARFGVIVLGDSAHIVTVLRNHIAFDGPSEVIVRRDLDRAYQGEELSPLPLQFVDVATYLDEYARSPAGVADRDYWAQRLAGLPPMNLPVDMPRDDVEAERADAFARHGAKYVAHFPFAAVTRDVDATTTARVLARAGDGRAPHLVLFLTSLVELLHVETQQLDIVIQTSLDVRPLLDAEGVVGGFNSPVLLRVEVTPGMTRAALLQRVRTAFSEAYAHARVSPNQDAPAHAGRVNFGFVPGAASPLRFGDVVGTPLHRSMPIAPFDVRPSVTLRGDAMQVAMAYNTRLFHASSAERMCARFVTALENLADRSDEPVGQ